MKCIGARLIKTRTNDGLVVMEDSIEISKFYIIDLDSKNRVVLHNIDHDIIHIKELVSVLNEDHSWGWIPLELLKLEAVS